MISDKELPVFDSYIAVVLHVVTNICTRPRVFTFTQPANTRIDCLPEKAPKTGHQIKQARR